MFFKDKIKIIWQKTREIFGPRLLLLFIVTVPLSFGLGIVEILFAFALQNFFQVYISQTNFESQPSWLTIFFAFPVSFLIGVAIVRTVVAFLSALLPSLIYELFNKRIRTLITQSEFLLDSNTFSVTDVSYLLSNASNKSALFINGVNQVLGLGLVIMSLLVGLFFMSPILAAIAIAIIVVLGMPSVFLKSSFQRYAAEVRSLINKFVEQTLHSIRNRYFLSIIGTNKEEAQRLLAINNSILKRYLFHLTANTANGTWPMLAVLILVVSLFVIMRFDNILSPGLILPFFYALIRMSQLIAQLLTAVGNLQFCYPFLAEIYDKWSPSLLKYNHYKTVALATVVKVVPSELLIKNLIIGRSSILVSGINLSLKSGDFLLVSGGSGIGKTTLLMTLIGLIKPLGGEVLWNSKSILDLDGHFFRTHISYSGADPFLLDTTIRQNILYGLKDDDRGKLDLKQAISLSASEFVYDLPGGIDFKLKEGGEGISAGQKQRLSIARALCRKPRVLIFDEATANIDETTEMRIIGGILKTYPDLIVLAVSHRHSLRQFASHFLEL